MSEKIISNVRKIQLKVIFFHLGFLYISNIRLDGRIISLGNTIKIALFM